MRHLPGTSSSRPHRRGLLVIGYLREVVCVSVLMLGVTAVSSQGLFPGESQAARRTFDAPPVYGLGFVSGNLWVNRLQEGASDYDLETGEMVAEWPLQTRALCNVARGGDDVQTTAVLCSTGQLMIVRDRQIHVRYTISPGEQNLSDVDVSRDGQFVVAIHPTGRIHHWSWNGKHFEDRLQSVPFVADLVRLHPDGRSVAIGSSDGHVTIWNLESFELQSRLQASGHRLSELAWSPKGDVLVTGSEDGRVRVWNIREQSVVWEAKSDVVSPSALAISQDGCLLAAGGFDKIVRLYDLADGSPQGGLIAHSGAIRAISFDPTGEKLVSGGLDGLVHIWSLTPRRLLRTIAPNPEG